MPSTKIKVKITDFKLFLKMVTNASEAVAKQTTIPILNHLYFSCNGNELTVCGSDNTTMVEMSGEVIESDTNTEFLVPSGKFIEIIKKLPKDEVEFIIENEQIKIKSGRSKFNLKTLPARDYPTFSMDSGETITFELPANQLISILKKVRYAVHPIQTRPVLTGVLFQSNKEGLTFIATDSHRLAQYNLPVDVPIGDVQAIVPSESIDKLMKIYEGDEKIHIEVTETQIQFNSKEITFISRLESGNYPDCSRIIPQNFKAEFTVSTNVLQKGLERASILLNKKKNTIVLRIGENKEFLIQASTEDGETEEDIEIEDIEGEFPKLTVNAKYLLDAIKSMPSKEVRIKSCGTYAPILLSPIYATTTKEEDKEDVLALCLPVRTHG